MQQHGVFCQYTATIGGVDCHKIICKPCNMPKNPAKMRACAQSEGMIHYQHFIAVADEDTDAVEDAEVALTVDFGGCHNHMERTVRIARAGDGTVVPSRAANIIILAGESSATHKNLKLEL